MAADRRALAEIRDTIVCPLADAFDATSSRRLSRGGGGEAASLLILDKNYDAFAANLTEKLAITLIQSNDRYAKDAVGAFLAERLRRHLYFLDVSAPPDGKSEAIFNNLIAHGISALKPVFTADEARVIREHLHGIPFTTQFPTHKGPWLLPDLPAEFSTAVCQNAPELLRIPHLLRSLCNPTLLRALTLYLRCPPTLTDIAVFVSRPLRTSGDANQNFHIDRTTFRFCRTITYLSDVAERQGPHQFVAGTQFYDGKADALVELSRNSPDDFARMVKLFAAHQLSAGGFPEADIQRAFGHRIITVKGSAGTGIVANTTGIHRGMPVQEERIALIATYAVVPIHDLDVEPVPFERLGEDVKAEVGEAFESQVIRYMMRRYVTA